MDPFLIVLLGLLAVMAIPGLVFFIADWFSPTESHHIDQPARESTSTGPLS